MIEYWQDLVRLSDETYLRLVITLLHFLWQGAVLALIVLIGDRALRGRSAAARYALSAVTLLCMPVCAATTFLLVDASVLAEPVLASAGGSGEADANLSSTVASDAVPLPTRVLTTRIHEEASPATGLSDFPARSSITELYASRRVLSAAARIIAAAYVLSVCAFLLRLGAGVWGGHRVRASARQIRDPRLRPVIVEQARQIGLKFVPIVSYCERVAVPTVIGLLQPMVLLPCSLVGLEGHHLPAVIAHELAHIRRNDLLMLVVQRVIESLLFFHPGTWYVSRRMSVEREMCCDDLVLETGKDRLGYAQALLEMADLCLAAKPAGVTALAAGGDNPSEFEVRIQRLIEVRPVLRLRLSRLGLTVMLACLAMAVALPGTLPTWANAEVTRSETNSAAAAESPEESGASQPANDGSPSSESGQQFEETPGSPSHDVSALCVDALGQAVEGAEVHLFQNQGEGQYLHVGPLKSDAEGRASFSPAVFSDASRNFDRWVYARVPGKLVGVARSVRWKGQQSGVNPDARVKMMPSRSVQGTVTVPDGFDPRSVVVTVRVMHVSTGSGAFDFESFPRERHFRGLDTSLPHIFDRRPDVDGRIRFDDVPKAGRLYLITSADGLGEAQWRNDLASRTFDKPIDIVIERERKLYGRVLSPEGEPVAGAAISARISENAAYLSTFRSLTNQVGEFEILGLPDSKFVVTASDPADRWVFRPLEGVHGSPKRGREFTLKMETGIPVSGKVVDQDGAPVDGAAISALAATQEGPGLDHDITDHKGQYRLRIPSGSAKLYFNALPDGFKYPRPQIIKRLEIVAGQPPVTDLDFTLERKSESHE